MNKIKITSIMIVAMFIGMGAASMCRAEETLNGEMKVEVSGWIGIVFPKIEFDNQSVTFDVEKETVENETFCNVNDTLKINLNITDNSSGGRKFILPRSMFYSIIMYRKPIKPIEALFPLFPLSKMLSRIFPVKQLLKSVNVVNSTLGSKKDNNITIPLKYTITNETFNKKGENLSMMVYVMGFLPGDINGIEGVPIIAHKTITLNISYELKVI
jgi:hypothetical protein